MKKIPIKLVLASLLLVTLAGCGSTDSSSTATSSSTETTADNASAADFFTTESVHTVSVDFDDSEYQAMLTEYASSGDKNWLKATITIDRTTFKNVGIKLKGNSTLRGISTSNEKANATSEDTDVPTGESSSLDAESPETLPWVIRLDKYEKGASYKGRSYFVVRGNSTETSLNEAVALAILNKTGVEAEAAAFTKFSVNDSDEKVRLIIDVPDDDLWTEDHFSSSGLLYKADANGDYSYRGTEEASYTDIFDQKYGEDDLTPLISFLDFINNSTDEEFASKLDDYIDTEAFATYLASQEIIQNTDDIDGPGNNGYLYYDTQTKKMTVVAWDHNLAFSSMGMGGGGDRDSFEEGQTPPDMDEQLSSEDRKTDKDANGTPPKMPDGEKPQGNMGGKENSLVTRFLANDTFKTVYENKLSSLNSTIIDSGYAESILNEYEELLTKNVSDLIDTTTIASEAKAINNRLVSDVSTKSESN